MPGIRFALIASLALLATACHAPEPPPTDEPPEPQATASTTPSGTELRDAMQAPIQKAEAVEAQVQAAADRTNAAEADAMQKIGFAWLKAHAPDRLTEAGLAATTPAIVRQEVFTALSEPDYQLLDRLDRDNASRGSRYVNEDDAGLWRQGVRLSESGLIAIEPHPKGGVFHITRLGEKALAGFRHSPKVQTSTNPQRNHYTERYDGID